MKKGKMKLAEKEIEILQSITLDKIIEPPFKLDPERPLVSGFISSISFATRTPVTIMNIGKPDITYLNKHISMNKEKYDIKFTNKLKEYDFFRIDFAFSPIKFDGMAFSNANFLVDLDPSESDARIIQLHPKRINHETQMECQYGITGSLSYKLIEDIKADVEGKYLRTKKYTRLHPHILAYGTGMSESRWEYRTTHSVDTIVGVHEMEMHVRQKRNTKTPGLIQIGELQIRYQDSRSRLKDIWLKITRNETIKSFKKEKASKENHAFNIEKR